MPGMFPGAGHLLLVAFLMISIPALSQSGGISNRWGAQSCCGNLHLLITEDQGLGLACVPLDRQRSSERSLGATPFCSEIHFRIAWPVADTWSLGSDRESTDREYAK